MTKLQKSKKGFTLTELAIVIAVIAILIAVLVPTFVSLINKAQVSSDSQLVKNLNTALSVDEATNGQANTMSEALEIASENGYNVDKLTPSSSGDIVWDQESNRFLLIDEEGSISYKDESATTITDSDLSTNAYQLWYIAKSKSDVDEGKYSYYIDYETTEVSATYGVDVGNNTGVAVTITGSNKASIIVNTNGGSLTIDAEKYDVYHYGTASTVIITKVAATSYHLYGEVASKIEIAQGRVVCEAGSSVSSIIVTADISSTTIAIVINDTAEVGGIGTTDSNSIASLSTVVTNNTSSTIEYSTSVTSNTAFAGGLGTDASPYQIATAKQFANIANLSEEMGAGTAYYFKLTDDIDLRGLSSVSTSISDYFCGTLDGTNTEDSNYKLIANDNLTFIFTDVASTATISNIDYVLISNKINIFGGTAYGMSNSLTIDNVDISTNMAHEIISLAKNQGIVISAYGYSYTGNRWNNVGRNSLTIVDCDVDVDISGVSYNAVFIGGNIYYTDAVIEDCTYSGTYYGECVSLAWGNPYAVHTSGAATYGYSTIKISKVVNDGSLYGTSRTPMLACSDWKVDITSNTELLSDYYTVEDCNLGTALEISVSGLAISTTSDNTVQITAASSDSVSYYVLTFYGGTRYVSFDSENSSYRFSIKIDKSLVTSTYDTKYTDGMMITVAQYQAQVDKTATFSDDDATEVYGEDGAKFWIVTNGTTTYYVFDFENDYYYFGDDGVSGAVDINSVSVTAYNSSDIPLGLKSISIK